jgi:hypothetical protein
MATVNVGEMAVRLGLDPSEFLDKMKGVQGFNGLMSGEMARAWKQTSREGTESFRLIDEALGVHLSRPLTRILTQEFPAFASALQSLLGAGVVGALGMAGFEAFEKVSRSIERAQKAEEEFEASTRKVENVFTSAMQSFLKADTLRSLTGIDKKLFEIDYSAVEEGRKKVDALAMAMDKEAKDAAEAHKWTTELLAGIGSVGHILFNSQSTLGIEEIGKQFSEFQRRFDQLSNLDALHGTRDSAKFVVDQIDKADKALTAMSAIKISGFQEFVGRAAFIPQLGLPPQIGFTQAEIDRQKQFLDNLKDIQKILTANAGDQKGAEDEARKADAAERQLKAQEAIAAFYKEMGSSLAKLQPETDPIKKLDAEIDGFRSKAEADFREIGRSAASALATSAGLAALESYEKKLDSLKIKLEGDILAKQALDLLNKPLPGGEPKGTALPFDLATPAMPTLGAGGRAAAKFDTFANDTVAQYAMASQAIDDAMSPQQKYKLVEQELDLLLGKKLIDQNAYNASLAQAIDLRSRSAKQGLEGAVDELNPGGGKMQELQQRMDALRGMQSSGLGLDGTKLNAGDLAAVQLAMEGIADEQNKILLKTGDINVGIKAWADDLQKVQSAGELAFEALSQASKGFEDNASQSFFLILNSQRGQQRQLIHDLEAMWSKYFEGLAQMGMKKGMDQLLAPVGKLFSGLGQKPQTAAGVPGATGAASLSSAGAILHTAATALLSAATALRASAGGVGGGAGGGIPFFGGGAGDAVDAGAAIPFFAEGGDATPGSSFISGEAGAEKVDLDRSGGAHITPLGSGGETHVHNYDMRGSIVSDDVMRKADAAHAIKASEARMMQAVPAMQREISLRKRT